MAWPSASEQQNITILHDSLSYVDHVTEYVDHVTDYVDHVTEYRVLV